MSNDLMRFSVAMPEELLVRFDQLVARRGLAKNRSEVVRDLVRDALVEDECSTPGMEVVGTLTIVFDHHASDLQEKLHAIQHDYFESIISSMHVHLDAHHCLEVIVLRGGKVVKFAMNDKCSAGTGKFLEVMANRLGVSQEELARLARAGAPTSISSMCTVFAESEVISLIGKGTPREDIAYAVIESVVERVSVLVAQGKGAPYFLTGGLCDNGYFVERLGARLGEPVATESRARFAGAVGAALLAAEGEGRRS